MPITDIIVRTAKHKDKPYKITDEKGLYLFIKPNGGKYWRYKYYFAGKEKVLALGVYPEVTLKESRDKRDEARKMLRDGIEPSQAKKDKKIQHQLDHENSLETVAREWMENRLESWTKRHGNYTLRRLEVNIFPALGCKPIQKITAPELLSVLREVEKRDALDLSHRLLQICSQIFRYAIATGRAERDIAADLRGALKTRKKENFSYLKENELPEFFSRLNAYDGDPQTKLGLRLLVLTFVRSTELRGAKWEEIDFAKAEWRIPAERMKMKEIHIVPLSHQAIAILKQLKQLNGSRPFVFPSRTKPDTSYISENTLLYALYRMGYHSQATTHGFRSTASTIFNEHGFRSDVIERQLAHGERNKVRGAYNHAQYLKERRELMQWWADHLDKLAGNGEVMEFKVSQVIKKAS
jgi:integrase